MKFVEKSVGLLKKWSWLTSMLLSFCSVLGFLHYGIRIEKAVPFLTNSILGMLLFALFAFIIYKAIQAATPRLVGYSFCGGLMLAAMLVLGAELQSTYAVNMFNWKKWIGLLFVAILFTAALICFLEALPRISEKAGKLIKSSTQERFFNGSWRYFIIVMGILFLCWVPVLLATYPGVYAYDTIYQVNSIVTNTLSSAHPIIHTLFLYGALEFGETVLGSRSLGLLVYSLIQMLALSATFAYACRFLAKRKASAVWQAAVIAGFALLPVHAMFSVNATKDVLYAASLLLVVLFTIDMIQDSEAFFRSWFKMGRYVFFMFLMFAWRNNGIYVFVVSVPFLVIALRKYWKQISGICLACLVLYGLYTGPLYRALNVRGGNFREMLSVPLQQIASAVLHNREEITDEEYAQICEILQEDRIKNYNPRISDPIKGHMNQAVFKADIGKYVKLWFNIGVKCPGTYINAFLNTNLGDWYPDYIFPGPSPYQQYMEFINYNNPAYICIPTQSKAPKLLEIYKAIGFRGAHQKIPVVSLLMSPGFAFWMLFLYMLTICYFKKRLGLLPPLFVFLYWGTLMLGPVANLRYMYPIMVAVPILWAFLLSNRDWNIVPKQLKKR